ncbi:MAG: hypothetical protein AAGA18_07425 [Verrucomicrobiota bacterium]
MKFQEILGYITIVKGAGLTVPMCMLEGITHFNYIHFNLFGWKVVNLDLSPLFWAGIIIGLLMLIAGLYVVAMAENQKTSSV